MEINSPLILARLDLGNFAAGGPIGVPSATVDICAHISIAQTTAGQTLVLPNPTVTAVNGPAVFVFNRGTAAFSMLGRSVDADTVVGFIWENGAWKLLSAVSNEVVSGAPLPTWQSGNKLFYSTVQRRVTHAVNSAGNGWSPIPIQLNFADLVAGVVPLNASEYVDFNGGYVTPITLPVSGRYPGDIFTFNHIATLDTVVSVTNTDMAAPFVANATNRGGSWIWNGGKWQRVTGGGTGVAAQAPNVFVFAKGTVLLGDPVPLGARPVTSSTNIASAVGLDGPLPDARMQVTFTTALPTADYDIVGSLRSVISAGWNVDNDTAWHVVSKTTTGFVMAVKEFVSVAQNLFFDFTILVFDPLPPVPALARYVGATATTPVVQLDNFRIRYNPVNLNIEIATVTGTEAIVLYSAVLFGSAQFDTAAAVTLTTGFVTLGDPGVVGGQEMRIVRFGPSLVTDSRHFEFSLHSVSATKIAMKLESF